MKKFLRTAALLFLATCIAGPIFAGAQKEPGTGTAAKPYSVALLIPYLGDQSFFDLAAAGIAEINKTLPDIKTRIIEIGTDDSKWESYFFDAAEQGYDVILSCNWQIAPHLNAAAKQYPNQKFINFDIETSPELPNVYSMFYATNEIGYLCGVVAAAATTSKMPQANPQAVIGFIGGMDIPGINDFMVGYVEGARSVNPNIKVAVSYVGGFQDVATAKEIALNQYKSGCDVIFACAGNAGNGVIDAAKELNQYVIGVDSDQALLFKSSDPVKSGRIITSGYKTIDKTILLAVQKAKEGSLSWGEHVKYSYKDAGVGIAKNEFYEAALTPEVKDAVQAQENKLKSGTVNIPSAFDMEAGAVSAFRDAVKP
ncbi:MAG: BMP family ABC transporter substrate-binding protein [Treponema sp.]|jgi:basic membrane protein A|nr:BMP family ABC transporter substrate-binding protein [Treponema sp.]